MKPVIRNFIKYRDLIVHHPIYVKYSLIIIPSVCVLIGLAIIVLVTVPQTLKIIKVNEQTAQTKDKQKAYQAKLQTLSQINADEYKKDLDQTLSILPTEKDIPSAIPAVLNVISKAGLQLDNISLGSTNLQAIDFKLDVIGTLDQVKNMINLTEKSPRIMKIISISIGNSNQNGTEASLEILTFYSPLDTNVSTNADAPITLLDSDQKNMIDNIATQINNSDSIGLTDTPTGKTDPFN